MNKWVIYFVGGFKKSVFADRYDDGSIFHVEDDGSVSMHDGNAFVFYAGNESVLVCPIANTLFIEQVR